MLKTAAFLTFGGQTPLEPIVRAEKSGFFDLKALVQSQNPLAFLGYKRGGLQSGSAGFYEKFVFEFFCCFYAANQALRWTSKLLRMAKQRNYYDITAANLDEFVEFLFAQAVALTTLDPNDALQPSR